MIYCPFQRQWRHLEICAVVILRAIRHAHWAPGFLCEVVLWLYSSIFYTTNRSFNQLKGFGMGGAHLRCC